MAQLKQKERDAKLSSVELAALQAKRAKRKKKKKEVSEVRTSCVNKLTNVSFSTIVDLNLISIRF